MIWGDRYLDSFKDQILIAIREEIIDDPYTEFDGRLEELDQAYVLAEDLVRSYLRGEPEDVYPERDVSNLHPPAV